MPSTGLHHVIYNTVVAAQIPSSVITGDATFKGRVPTLDIYLAI